MLLKEAFTTGQEPWAEQMDTWVEISGISGMFSLEAKIIGNLQLNATCARVKVNPEFQGFGQLD